MAEGALVVLMILLMTFPAAAPTPLAILERETHTHTSHPLNARTNALIDAKKTAHTYT